MATQQINATNITPPRVPLIDSRTGLISREWYRFFLSLFTLTGSGTNYTSLSDLQVAPLPVTIADVQALIPSELGVSPSAGSLVEQIAELRKQIDAINSAPVGSDEFARRATNGAVPLNQGGTGDSVNFSWTGATKTLVANNINSASGAGLACSGESSLSFTSSKGDVSFTAGDGQTAGAAGKVVQIAAGNGNASGVSTGGDFVAAAGNAPGSGAGGGIFFTAGSSDSGAGGDVFFTPGFSTSGAQGNLYFYDSNGNTMYQVADVQKQAWFGATPIVRPTTGGASASFTANAGTAVNDASTFDGYTIKQVVKALRNLGLLT